MNKKIRVLSIAFILCLWVAAFNAVADNAKIDSLNAQASRNLTQPEKAMASAREALRISNETKYEKGKADSYVNLALVYIEWEQPGKAIDFLNLALKYYSGQKNDLKVADLYNQLARIYIQIDELEKAGDFLKKAIAINRVQKNNHALASNYSNLGSVYKYSYLTDSAIYYSELSLKIFRQEKDTPAIINQLGNLGAIYGEEAKINDEIKFYQEALELAAMNKSSRANTTAILYNYATSLFSLRRFEQAEKYLMEAIMQGSQSKDYKSLSDSYNLLYRIYRDQFRNPEGALFYLEKAKAFNDSSLSKEGMQKILRLTMQTDFEEKQKEDSLKQAAIRVQEKIQFEEKSKRNRIIIWGVILLAGILGFSAVMLWRSNRQKEATNKIISEQKHEIEEKSKEILDSILYAKKIQDAVLPSEDDVKALFPKSFVYYRPKDIVGGDFYFITESKKEPGSIFLSVADCTGHGVPGGFMSMLGTSFLQEIIEEDGETVPGFILNRLRHKVIQSLRQSENLMQNKDGMDITLIKFNKPENKVYWSVANHSIYFLCHKPFEQSEESWCSLVDEKNGMFLYRMKGQKQPIGYYPHMTGFETRSMSVEGLSAVFMFSDGVVDQFGGPNLKKFKHSSLEKWIWDSIQFEMPIQKEMIDHRLMTWQGEHEQLDDICLISIKFS